MVPDTTVVRERFYRFFSNRWVVFIAAMWVQSCAGIGYLFGSISPVIKKSLKYNQRQVARLAVAKDLGDSVGFLAGSLCEVLPLWAILFIGALQNFVGYGCVWLIVTGRAPPLPLWAMCILIFVGNNGETYYNTAALVSCVQNFRKSRGPIVGILKGFAGLSGAILTQVYTMLNFPDQAALIFILAIGPAMVVISLLFIVRPVGGHGQVHPSDGSNFTFVYSLCLLLAAYLMAVMLLEDLVYLSHTVITIFTIIMLILILAPVTIPIKMSLVSEPAEVEREVLVPRSEQLVHREAEGGNNELIFGDVEAELLKEVDFLPASERQKQIAQLQALVCQAAAEGAVGVRKRRRGPHRGEEFTLMQALIKADFWLMFVSLLLGSGSGLTVIDNLGQISESQGYDNPHVFVSLISIWNFLGRIGGGFFSEIIVRDYGYPRPVAIAAAQMVMAVGHVFFSMGWTGALYIGTLLIGLGYGAHWAIVPATTSELFGLTKFGALYNFLTLANPTGSLVFSGIIASNIYDREADRQAHMLAFKEPHKCEGAICFFLTSMIMSVICIIAAVLSLILVQRTKIVYAHLYGKSQT